jgi:hypothetical protein
MPAVSSRPHQAGSGRTVAAAVAQAFAVRAAAGRAGGQPSADPPPPDDSTQDVPESDEQAATPRDDVDPAAMTDPDGRGLAAMATPEPDASGNGWVATAAHEENGDRPADPRPDSGWQAPETAAPTPVAGFVAGGWPVPVPPDPERAAVPAPRPDNEDEGRQRTPAPDARDRLLAVLLDDPERAVGAADELENCLRELDRLSDAVRAGRAGLRDVLHRLAAAGLRPDQLARLARLPEHDVRELLEAAPAEQQA